MKSKNTNSKNCADGLKGMYLQVNEHYIKNIGLETRAHMKF